MSKITDYMIENGIVIEEKEPTQEVKIPNDLLHFMKNNPTANFNDYLDELMVQSYIKDVETRHGKKE